MSGFGDYRHGHDDILSQAAADASARDAVLRAELDAELAQRVHVSSRGVPGGVATLDGGGRIPSAQLPPVAITDTFAVASESAMLALDAQSGDVAIRSDIKRSFILKSDGNPATLADWLELQTPTDAVLSVDGLTGVVSLPTDASAGIGSKRTLGTGSNQAAAGNHFHGATTAAPARALNVAFRPSTTRLTLCTYTFRLSIPSNTTTRLARVEFRSDTQSTPQAVITSLELQGGIETVPRVLEVPFTVAVPAGHWVLLASSVAGGGSVTLVHVHEATL